MPRPLRLHFAHAIYHVINRGNYRAPIFATPGAAQAFVACLVEAVEMFRWLLHSFTLLSNHFHLALETPEPNLTEGVHWLESTFATRFNRFRKERGHVFQGRYYAGLVQPGRSLLRLVNYIHLNPVRAKLTDVANLPEYPWSSLPTFLNGPRFQGLSCADWLGELSLADDAEGWQAYAAMLANLAADPEEQKRQGFDTMESAWAIGDETWCREIAANVREIGVAEAPCGPERDAIRAARWADALEQALRRVGRSREELAIARKGADWKIALAQELRESHGANHRWLAREICLGKPTIVRYQLCRLRQSRMGAPRSAPTPLNPVL